MNRQKPMHRRSYGRQLRKSRFFKPVGQRLDERIVLALDFGTLADGLSNELQGLNATVTQTVRESATPLPVLGQPLNRLSADVDKLLTGTGGILDSLNKAANRLVGTKPQTDALIRSAVFPRLSGVLGDLSGNNRIDEDDVIVTSNSATGDLAITVLLEKTIADVKGNDFNFDLGLPGVPFSVTSKGQLNVHASASYDRLTFGLRNNVFYTESPGGVATMQISVGASLARPTLVGTLGFFQIEASPRPGGSGVGVNASLVLSANGTRLSNPRLQGNAVADLQLQTSLTPGNRDGGQIGLPNFKANLYLNWQLAGAHNAARGSLGSAPTLELRNVQFGLGSYLSSVMKPITDNLFRFIKPLQPVLDVLDDPIPGLSDFTEAVGAGETSLESLIKFATPFLTPDLQLVANAITTFIDVGQAVLSIESDPRGSYLLINVGNLSL
ncbi:MAG: hypothetical protein KDB00_01075, partial [Planctomycetales bacterium]|nr:hypothetical protein [Planctomycetales bacterium]